MDITSVVILGQKYKISKKAPNGEVSDAFYGWIEFEKNKIWISDRLSLEHRLRTLFHEMGHGVFYRNGVKFSGMIPVELEEILVETFASMQYEFLKDLIKRLLKYEDNILRGKLLAISGGAKASGEDAGIL